MFNVPPEICKVKKKFQAGPEKENGLEKAVASIRFCHRGIREGFSLDFSIEMLYSLYPSALTPSTIEFLQNPMQEIKL